MAEEDMNNYLDQVQKILDNKKKEGPFFYQVSKYLDKNSALPQEKSIDFRRCVTARAYSQLLFPLIEALCEIETKALSEEHRTIKEDAVGFLSQAFPELDREVVKKRSDGLDIRVKSIMAKSPEAWENIKGYHKNGDIGIVYAERDNRGTVVHEVLHGLSYDGRTARFEDSQISNLATKI